MDLTRKVLKAKLKVCLLRVKATQEEGLKVERETTSPQGLDLSLDSRKDAGTVVKMGTSSRLVLTRAKAKLDQKTITMEEESHLVVMETLQKLQASMCQKHCLQLMYILNMSG